MGRPVLCSFRPPDEGLTLQQPRCAIRGPWDCRLQEQSPERICAILYAHAAMLQPLCQTVGAVSEPMKTSVVVSPHQVLLQPMDEEIVVTTAALEEVIDTTTEDMIRTGRMSPILQRIQHGLLSVTLRAIRIRLQRASSEAQRAFLQTKYILVRQVRQWHRRTHQRVVNAHYAWCEERRQVLWHLTVGVPLPA